MDRGYRFVTQRATRALAMAGARDEAQAVLARVRVFDEFPLWEAERILTVAWVHAISGVLSKASAAARDSAHAGGATPVRRRGGGAAVRHPVR